MNATSGRSADWVMDCISCLLLGYKWAANSHI